MRCDQCHSEFRIWERIAITEPFENVSQRSNTLHVLNTNDETRNNIPDEVSELWVPGTHFDRQQHTHRNAAYKFFFT